MANQFDVVVIGAGPGGYVAAIRAAQLGFSVACIESESYADPKGEVRLGGTCLNVGCIPSKALLQSSELYDQAGHSFVMHGIGFDNVRMDVTTMLRRKENIVTQLTGGIRSLFKKHKITLLSGHGSFTGREGDLWQIAVAGKQGSENVFARHVIVATGSMARHLPGIPVDNKLVCDNVGALCFDSVPKRLGVIGAGVIGLELGSVWKRLGAEVNILEAVPDFLAAADQAVAKEAWKVFTRKQGLNIHLGVKIGKVSVGKKTVTVEYEPDEGTQTLECDKLIVSVGKQAPERPHLDILKREGMDEGIMVAELIAGQTGHIDYNTIPWVIYTHPEIAWVGKTEEQLKREGIAYRSGQIPFAANGRALGQGDTTGFVKMLADAQTDRILGVHVIGNNASELIAEAVVAMEFGASSEDIARICHAHPTLSEVMHEAALAVDKRPLHF